MVALAFNVGEVMAFFSDAMRTLRLGPVSVDLEPSRYAGIVPRLTGQVADPNRAGLIYLLYMFALLHGARPGPMRRLGLTLAGLFIVATLSRSVVLAGFGMGLTALLMKTGLRASRRVLVTGVAAAVAVSALALAVPTARAGAGRVLAPLESRWSFREGSAREHAYLLRRGVQEGTRSVRRAALGIGYGNSFHTLQDVFPQNKYGNFHSLYVTFLAESGVLALLLALVLMGVPLIRPGPLLPVVVGLWLFNVFYQAGTEPTFWFILALAWLTASLSRPGASSPGLADVAA
jgi:O-antigen ligase